MLPEDAARPNLAPHARRAFCSIGSGVRHQLGCCSLFFKGAGAGAGPDKPEGKKDEFPEELVGQFIKARLLQAEVDRLRRQCFSLGSLVELAQQARSSTHRPFFTFHGKNIAATEDLHAQA